MIDQTTAQTIQLRPIDKTNWKMAARLKLGNGQEHFVAPNWYSMLEALFSDGALQSAGIYDGETLVGYTLFGIDSDSGGYWIVRLMIDINRQHQGYGRAAMKAIIDEMQQRYDCHEIYIGFEPDNTVARNLYESLGFQDTGEIFEGELVFKLILPDGNLPD